MKACPNKSNPDWIKLVDSVGEFEAYRVFISNNYEIPVAAKPVYDKKPVTARAQAKDVLVKKGIIDKYNKLKVDYATAIRATGELNRELRQKYGFKEQLIVYEDDKKSVLFKEDLFKSIDKQKGINYNEDGSPAGVQSKLMFQYSDDGVITVKEALNRISTVTEQKFAAALAKRLAKVVSNNVDIQLVTKEEMQALRIKWENRENQDNSNLSTPSGAYVPEENQIYVLDSSNILTILHEIIHAFTYNELKSDSREARKLKELYGYIQKNHSELNNLYPMSTLDEFMVGIFTRTDLIKELKQIPSMTSRKLSLWDELLDIIASALNYLGISKPQAISMLEEAMDLGIRVMDSSKAKADVNKYSNVAEAFDTSELEIYYDLSTDEKTYYETLSMTAEQEETMKSVIANQNKGLNADGSFYVKKNPDGTDDSSIEYIRVSDKLDNGFSDPEGRYDINREAGNDADTILSAVILGKKLSEVGETPRIDDSVKEDLYDYFTALIKHLTKDGSVVMTQQIFSNDEAAIAGATDIIVIKPNGKIDIYDLKTSVNSTATEEEKVDKSGKEYTKSYTKGYAGKKSKKAVHTEQQSMYKRLAELQGFEVDNLHIVPVYIKIKEGKVVSAMPEPIIELEYNQTLAEGIIPDDISEAMSAADLVSPEKKSLEKIRKRLSGLISHWKNKEQAEVSGVLDKLSELHDKLDTVEELESIEAFIREAKTIADGFKETMKEIKRNPTSKASIIKLGNINTFMDTFEVLTEIQNLMYRESSEKEQQDIADWRERHLNSKLLGEEEAFLAENPYPGIKSTLDETVATFRGLKVDYLTYGKKAYAKLLFNAIPENVLKETKRIKRELLKSNPDNARAAGLITSVLDMERELGNLSEDVSGWSRWMGSAAGDENAIVALTSLMIKNTLEPVTEELIKDEAELGSVLEKYLKESGKSRDNVVELNKEILEIVESKKQKPDGTWETVKQKQFVDKTDWKKFGEAQSKMYKELEEAGVERNSKEWNTARNKWYKDNTHVKADYKAIVADRKANLSPYEFKQWTAKNYPSKVPQGELREPNSEYVSEKWKKLYDASGNPISAAGRYHQGMLAKYDEIINQLDYKDRVALTSKGYKLPSVPKSEWERTMQDKQVGRVIKDKFKITAHDTNYKNKILDNQGREIKEIPKFYTQEMEADEVSSDVFESLLMASKNWRYYNAKSKIQAEVQLVRDLVDNQVVDKSDTLGNAISDIKDKFFKGKAKKNVNNLADKLNDHLDVVFYGSEDERADVKIGKQSISVDKTMQNVMWASSVISLTGNIISGISNATLGNLANLIETSAKEYLTPKALAKATARYSMSLGAMALDVNKLTGKSLETQLSKLFDFDQAYVESLGKNQSGSRIKQVIDSSSLGFVNNSAEHQIYTTAGFAYLESIKWVDGQFRNRKDYLYGKKGQELKDSQKKFDESKESLMDAYELDSKGVIKLKGKYTLAQKDRSSFKNTLHEMNKYNHGNYSKHDKNALQRLWYGKLALFFRKHIQPGLAKRFGRARINYALGGSTEGMYVGTAKASYEFISNMISEMKAVGFMEAWDRTNLTEQQKANMRRTVAEGGALLITMMLVGMLGGDDDEPRTWAENLALLQARRLQSELNFYSNPLEAFRVIKSPTVAMGTVESAVKFGQGLFKFGEDEYYSRDTGFWKKGDSKDLARLTKLIPFLKSMIALATPEEQIKIFNKVTL